VLIVLLLTGLLAMILTAFVMAGSGFWTAATAAVCGAALSMLLVGLLRMAIGRLYRRAFAGCPVRSTDHQNLGPP
jgi:hypothetical protein